MISIRGIRAYGRHGANPGERDRPQPFDIEVEVRLDLSQAARSDKLEDTLDYAQLHARIVEIVERNSFVLLERLGEVLLESLMADARVRAARVSIGKPGLLNGATPWVTLTRQRDDHDAAS